METPLKRLEDRADQQGFFTHEEWNRALALEQMCKKLGITMPLSQVIIELKGSTSEHRQQFLEILLKELEPFSLIYELDPLSVSLGSDWFLIDKAIETGAIQKDKLLLCHQIVKDMESQDIVLTMAEVCAMKGLVPESLVRESTRCPSTAPRLTAEERENLISLEYLCQRERDGELLPPILTIEQLSLSVIPREVVKEGLSLKKGILDKWGLDLTLAQILSKRYLIDPSLLHLLFLTQVIIKSKKVSLSLGKIPAGELNVFHDQGVEELQIARDEARQFLAWTYRMAWLDFNSEEEQKVVQALEKQIGKKIEKSLKIQESLEKDGLYISLPKILALSGLDADMLMEIVSSEDVMGSKFVKKSKQLPEGPPPKRKIPFSAKIDDNDLSKILLKEGVLKEKDLSAVIMVLEENRAKGSYVRLGELLIQRGLLKEKELHDILQKVCSAEDEVAATKEKRPSSMDLKLTKMITDYKILSPVELQNALHLQSIFYQAGISKPIEEVLVQCRFLSPGMANDLIGECKRRDKKILADQISETNLKQQPEQTRLFELKMLEAVTPPKVKERAKDRARRPTVRQAQDSTTKDREQRALKKQLRSSIVLVALLLLVVIIPVSLLKIMTDNTESVKDNPLPPLTSTKNTAPPTDKATIKPQHHKETFASEMERKGYHQWGPWWVTTNEKEILGKAWDPSQKERINLELDIDHSSATYISTANREIQTQGRFSSSVQTLPRPVVLTIYLLGPTDRGEVYLEKHGLVRTDMSFQETLDPISRPLLPGRYVMQLRALPSNQDPLIREIINWTPRESWMISFQVGNKQEIDARLKKDEKFMKDLLFRLKKQEKELSRNLRNNSNAWFEELKELQKQLKEKKEECLIPLFAKTESGVAILLDSLVSWGEKMDLWLKRRSLYPPLSFPEESFSIQLNRTEAEFERESKVLMER